MSKTIKLKNDVYLDSSVIVHNRSKISDILNYSTNEVKIGKWIDGKPLYRITKRFYFNNDNFDVGIPNLDKVVNMYGRSEDGSRPINFFVMFGTTYYISTWMYGSNLYNQLSNEYVGYYNVTFEYTKTTD